MLHANLCSIGNKYLELELLCNDTDSDVVCVTETWTKDAHLDVMIIENYELASFYNRKLFNHGGTAIFVKKNTDYKVRNDLNKLTFEMNCEISAIELKPSKIVIVCLYRPGRDFDIFFDILSKILHIVNRERKNIIIAGDFNLNVLILKKEIQRLNTTLKSFNCNYVIREPTRTKGKSATCLDNFIVNSDVNCEGKVLRKLSDHNSILLIYDIVKQKLKKKDNIKYGRLFSEQNCNYFHYLFKKELESVKYNIYLNIDCNKKIKILSEAILFCYNIAFPIKRLTVRKKKQKLNTKGIHTSKDTLSKMEILQDFAPCENRERKIKKYRKILRKVLTTAIKVNYSHRIHKAKNKIRESWKIINEQVNKKRTTLQVIDEIKNEEGTIINDPKKIAELFNSFFLNIAHRLSSHLNIDLTKCDNYLRNVTKTNTKISFSTMDTNDIRRIIIKLNDKYTKDVYDMSTHIIKKIVLGNDDLLSLICTVLNSCITEGVFPDMLKIGRVVPLYKNGDRLMINNYRPICVLPVLSKILEATLKDQIVSYFETNNLFTLAQFGFRKEKSTEMAIRNVIYYVLEALDRSQKSASVFCDLSKAFDCLRYDILLNKLEFYGFSGTELNIIKSYLSNRSQIVTIAGTSCSPGCSSIGVPQGSILGPVLFLVYVNDLPHALPDWSFINLFADDTHVGVSDRSLITVQHKINEIINSLESWFCANGIILNKEKTKVVNYSTKKNKDCGTSCQETVFLGYTVDNTLSHASHINKLNNKVSHANYVLMKLKPLVDKKTLINVYFAYVHSLLSYAITVWGNANDIKSVLISQKRSIRIINGLHKRESAKPYFVKNKIMTVISLYIYKSLLEVHKSREEGKLIKNSDIHDRNLRNKERLALPSTRLMKTRKNGLYNKIKMYNKLPLSIIDLPFPEFKNKIKTFFEQKPFYNIKQYQQMFLNEEKFL